MHKVTTKRFNVTAERLKMTSNIFKMALEQCKNNYRNKITTEVQNDYKNR